MRNATALRKEAFRVYIAEKNPQKLLPNAFNSHLLHNRELRREYVGIHQAAQAFFAECAAEAPDPTAQQWRFYTGLRQIQEALAREQSTCHPQR